MTRKDLIEILELMEGDELSFHVTTVEQHDYLDIIVATKESQATLASPKNGTITRVSTDNGTTPYTSVWAVDTHKIIDVHVVKYDESNHRPSVTILTPIADSPMSPPDPIIIKELA